MDTQALERDAGEQVIGQSLPNIRAGRLIAGRGRFVVNLTAPRLCEAAIVRAPVAHGALSGIDTAAARAVPGVVAVFTAADFAAICAPWEARHALFPDARVPAERPLAEGRVRYVGEPVAIVIGETAEAAREGAEAVIVEVAEEPSVTDPLAATADGAPVLHDAFAAMPAPNVHAVLTQRHGPASPEGEAIGLHLTLTRIAPQPLETRSVLADYDPSEEALTVTQSHQHPHQMQDLYARLLDLAEHKVRVICADVGGGFGMKQQVHPDEMAAVCASRRLGRPVRLVVSRGESLITDAQARDHRIAAHATYDASTRRVTGFSMRDLCGIGAFPHFPRTSFGEGAMTTRLLGAPYAVASLDAESTLVFQNRPHLGHYRGVGHPVAAIATEAVMDRAARRAGEHPIAFRRRHLHDRAALPTKSAAGIAIDRYRMAECLDRLEAHLVDAPRGETGGTLHGVGVACLLQLYANGPHYYGDGGIHISGDESAVVRMEPSGVVRVATANTDQGQGADQAVAQIVADRLGLGVGDVEVISGDSATAPYGGGACASRCTALGGAAAEDGAAALGRRLLESAALLLQRRADELVLRHRAVCESDGRVLMGIGELAKTCHFKPYLFPAGHDAGLVTVGRHTSLDSGRVTTAAFAACVSIDPATGHVAVTKMVAAHDTGTVVNPASVEAQLHGGMLQGLGQALMEAIRLDEAGQPLTGSYMDYAMPRADDAPPIEVALLPPLPEDDFAPRGVGEAGISGAPAALFNAVNDALAVRGAAVDTLPMTPLSIWQALQAAAARTG